MTEQIAVFRSRTQAIECNARLRAHGVPSALINTPKEANIGCGLSIKFPQNMFPRVRSIILNAGFSAFYGFLKIKNY